MNTDKKCPFCEMFKDNTNDFVFIEPLNPVVKGHLLVIPRQHTEDFTKYPAISGEAMEYASEVAKTIGGDFNLITSKGKYATQTIKHLHIHLIPRTKDDGLKLPWSK